MLADAWGPERREAIERALHDTGLPYADDTFTRVRVAFDGYASDWADGYYRACVDGHRGQPVDARMACLERARQQLQLITDELVAPGPEVVRHAFDLVLSLPELERCDDPTTADVDLASLDDPEVRALIDELTRASILAESWRFPEAAALLEDVDVEARALQRDPLVARVGILRSRVALARGMTDDAARFARDALTVAERAEHDELELLAWRSLATASRRQGELARAAFELERAEAIAERHTIAAEHRADLRFDRGDLLRRQGKHADAVAAYQQARAAYQALAPEHRHIPGVLSDMALAQLLLGQQEAAIDSSEQSLAMQTRRLGPQHPSLVPLLSSVADQYMTAGRSEEALALRRRALAILEREPDDNLERQLVLAAVIVGDLVSLRRFDEAERALDDAERTADTRLASNHPVIALLANAHGNLELDRRRYATAIPHYERALALTSEADPLNRLVMLVNLSLSLARAGRIDDAMERAEQTRAALQSLAPDSAPRAGFEIYLAEVDRLAGHHARALAGFTRASELLDRLALGDDLRVMVWFGLAREESSRERARAHAEQAQALAAALPGFESEHDEIAAWLAEHP